MKKYILPSAIVFLSVLFPLSFVRDFGKDGRAGQISLVPQKDFSGIVELSLSLGEKKLTFRSDGGLWRGFLQSADEDGFSPFGSRIFPVDAEDLEKALHSLKKTYRLYKISDKNGVLADFSLDGASRLSVRCSFSDGRVSDFWIGKPDFTGKMRFAVLPDINGVWKIGFDFFDFFHLEPRFWHDPYLFPRNAFSEGGLQLARIRSGTVDKNLIPDGSQKFMKLLELRHGDIFFDGNFDADPVVKIHCEYGRGMFLDMDFYESSDGNFVVHYHGGGWNYFANLSAWTYRTFVENL